jgi:hypothetical protein
MTYHSIHLEFPAQKPFDGENWFETFVGHFVKPLLATGLVKQYWFTRYGNNHQREIRLRLTTEKFDDLNPIIQKQIKTFGFTDRKDELDVRLAGNLGNGRFLSPNASNLSEERRAQLTLNFLHALAVMFAECLIGPDAEGYFCQEKNMDINNPHGSIFETLHHLFCNTTNVVTEVELLQITNNQLFIQSPLYSSHLKANLVSQKVSFTEFGRMRVTF